MEKRFTSEQLLRQAQAANEWMQEQLAHLERQGYVYDPAEMCWKMTDWRGRVYRVEIG